jgi:hypothetical protein
MIKRNRYAQMAFLTTAAVLFAIGCASNLPAVLTSTDDSVAIEFEQTGSLSETTVLAKTECEKYGKTAKFDVVDKIATPSTRIAKYECVGGPEATETADVEVSPSSTPADEPESPAKSAPAEESSDTEAPAASEPADEPSTSE